MTMPRRSVLSLLGLGGVGMAVAGARQGHAAHAGAAPIHPVVRPFQPVRVPLPVDGDGLSGEEQQRWYRTVGIEDRLTLPEGFRADVLAAWGDRLGTSRFGFNNDHLGFVQHSPDRASMTVNFEYISPTPWVEGFADVVGHSLPFRELVQALADRNGVIDCSDLGHDTALWLVIRSVADEAMTDLGLGVMSLKRNGDGAWVREHASHDRRITGLTGLLDASQRLVSTGPAVAVFQATDRLGYDDGLGAEIIGSFANCGGGITPWGTVLSAEENIQSQVAEPVFADGSSVAPSERPFVCRNKRIAGLGNVYGLAGNKYGWMVEVDPEAPDQPVRKHTALGRFRHEAVAVRAEVGQPLQVYSGCDRRGGHLYRFVSSAVVLDLRDRANSHLFEAGELQVARFNPDGSGVWLALKPEASVNPFRPSRFQQAGLSCPVELPHSDRRRAGAEPFHDDAAVEAYRTRFSTLADLYRGTGQALQGAILVDAHLAASAIGATPTARPEDTKIDSVTGDLLIAFTSGYPGSNGGADPAVFQGPQGQSSWGHGWVMRLGETDTNAFSWRMAVTGGEPWSGGLGFANPDNLALDRLGNLWVVTDRSTSSSFSDVFGNNSCWLVPRDGSAALCLATGPMECELTGVCLDQLETNLFLAVQHPGEAHGARRKGAVDVRTHALVDRNGQRFQQTRWVPRGSNWPAQAPGRPPRPGVVAIRRWGGEPILMASSP